MSRTTAMLMLVASMAMTGANVPIAKRLLPEFAPEQLLLLRFALASVVLLPLSAFESGPPLGSLSKRQWGVIAILAAVGSVLFTSFILAGVQRTSGASAGIILAALPAVVALIGCALGERLRRGELAMIALAVAGIALVQANPSASPSGSPASSPFAGSEAAIPDALAGNLLILMAVLCEATFVVAARRISADVPPLRLSLAVAMVSLAMCIAPAWLAQGGAPLGGVGIGTWALFGWYTLTASALCTVLWYLGVGRVETWAAGLATAAVPVSALAVSALWLGETISLVQLLGAGLIVAAITAGTLQGPVTRS